MKTLKLIWKNKDLRNKLLIVIAILFGIRILSGIPTPGVNRNYFKLLLAQNSTLNFFNAISGNGLSNLSIMALSITPYMKITKKEHVYPLIPFLTTGYIIILIILTVQGQSISWLL